METKDIWVDPPSGWRYGFPRIKRADDDRIMEQWLADEGYPVSIINQFADGIMPVRCWEVEDEG